MIYQDVFACVPNDLVHSRYVHNNAHSLLFSLSFVMLVLMRTYVLPYARRSSIRQSMAYWKEKLGHTTIDLGIAPEKLESYQNGDVKNTDPLERLQAVRGHLVSFPLDFMCQEDLRPVFNESEFYASPQVFH